MAASKGTLYLSVKLFAEKRFGPSAVDLCLAQLSREDRELLGSIVAVGWYPLEPVLRFHRVLDQSFGKGDLSLCREVGVFSADWQLNNFHKLVLKMRNPKWIVARASKMWRSYHDTGRWEIEEPEPNCVVGRLHDFAVVDQAFCVREQGWFLKAFEMTGGKDVRVEEPRCRALGDPFCEYRGYYT